MQKSKVYRVRQNKVSPKVGSHFLSNHWEFFKAKFYTLITCSYVNKMTKCV